MSLVEWNATMTAGRGRTGTRYFIAETGSQWSISVDGDMLCLTDTAAQAVQRTEYLEALKHVVAGEMKDASEAILAKGTLPLDEHESVEHYGRRLGDLFCLIATEQDRRRKRALG